METALPPLIQALLEPGRYLHPVDQVELVQTHISWVLLAGDFAYKIKKPVKLSFLDFSTLALRQARCQDEVRLNRRFAPDLYLDVVGIYRTAHDPRFEVEGEPIEFAVRMRRFDQNARLDQVCASGRLQPAHLSALAQALGDFHDHAERAINHPRFGSPEVVAHFALANFDELQRLPPDWIDPEVVDTLRDRTQTQLRVLEPVLRARQQQGWIREGHGDLHLGNLMLQGEQVRLFDCIEFSDDLRWIDVLSDVAFVYVDLLTHRQGGLACWFINAVLSRSGDYAAVPLLRLYALYRAMVRAKVAALRSLQTGQCDAQLPQMLWRAQTWVAPRTPQLLITHGLSGSGKTFVSDQWLLADRTATTLRLRSDVERKRLAGLSALAASASGLNAGLYAPDSHQRIYDHLLRQAEAVLRAGWSVLVDATFLRRADRAAFQTLAQTMGAGFGILAPQADEATLRARIVARQTSGSDASEATLAVLDQQLRQLEPLDAQEITWVVPAQK